MQTVWLQKWAVVNDPDLTREAYAQIDCGCAEDCGCEECFNFAAARHLVYSSSILELLEWLGIDPQLEAWVQHDCEHRGAHTYTVWFYLVGKIEDGPATTVARCAGLDRVSLERADEGIGVGFCADASDAPEAFRGLPVVRLELCVQAPWISNAPEPLGA